MKALELRSDDEQAEAFLKKLKSKVRIDNFHRNNQLKKLKGFFRGDGGLSSQIVSSTISNISTNISDFITSLLGID